MASRILLVDDDVELAGLLRDYLSREGFEVDAVHEGPAGLERARAGEHAIVILDVMLPGMNGLDVLRALRATSAVPVLMLTARGDDVDRIVGLEMGADDYLPKPFNPRELAARVRAIQRRAEAATRTPRSREVLSAGDLSLDVGARVVRRGGDEVTLTSVEFSLLELLLRTPGKIVTRESIAEQVLGRRFSPFDRSVDVHVSNLRKKLGPGAGGRERIKTVRGAGYLLAEDER
ncbi:response regulator transcription factor [Sandaracinus amylolyticus]|uniref:Copper-sensing two-component system response regulator CpxR n=1 Tax=Sandaracinus amylolyticus TaxID=927083 RepID=A0A0F6YGN5_9BACT|nr:response regulator transcription factor [Sandaracinus amylolyticus]AKF04907.1 Copper-sensing two-component system response regulator CpxR [Sandaracinus amylolyticus]